MDRGCAVKRGVDDRNPPPPDVKREPLFHQRIGNIAERVIEKMREDVREHHEPAGEPYLPNTNTAQPTGEAGGDAHPGRVHASDCWCLHRHAETLLALDYAIGVLNHFHLVLAVNG
ncbi:MAG: hypothetical protein WAV38_19215 [Xanthobacteraceae bacterium]|jgi:hypothetical protein